MLFFGQVLTPLFAVFLSGKMPQIMVIDMADLQTQIDYPRGLTFEHVWAALQETDRVIKESQRETAKRQEETDRIVKEIGKRLGDFTNSFGEVVEHMISPNLLEKFKAIGFDFEEASTRHKIRNKKYDISFEIDVFLQNGDTAMLVEIKSNLTISDINKHVIRLEKMRRWADLRGDKRRFLGAVAGIAIEGDAKEYALNQGFFFIDPSGENFNITVPFDKPKEW